MMPRWVKVALVVTLPLNIILALASHDWTDALGWSTAAFLYLSLRDVERRWDRLRRALRRRFLDADMWSRARADKEFDRAREWRS